MTDGGRKVRYLHCPRTQRFGGRFKADAALVVVVDVDAIDVEAVVSRTLKRAASCNLRSPHRKTRAYRKRAARIDVQLRNGGDSGSQRRDRGKVAAIQGQFSSCCVETFVSRLVLSVSRPAASPDTVTDCCTAPGCNLKS